LDAASNTQVEKVREAIIDTVALASSRDRYKVFILDEVHMLSSSSFNALLKTIEEPPAHVVFILATTEKHKVPATIVSRCQTFRFRPLTTEEISSHLMELAEAETIDLTAAAARIIAKNAGGAMRDALTLLDRAIAFAGNRIDEKLVGEMLGLTPDELIKEALDALIHKNNKQLHQVFETLKNEGFDANAFLKDIKTSLGEAFYFSLGQGGEPFSGAKQLLEGVSPGFLAQLSRKINKLMEEVKFADDALISAEVGLFTVMDSVLDIEDFVRRLEALEKGAPAMPPSPRRPVVTKETPAVIKPTSKNLPEKQNMVAPEQHSQKEIAPTPDTTLSNRQVWDKMLKQFEKSPFVYDVMLNSTVEFKEENWWTLSFPAGKEFYQIPAQNKLKELAEAASKISGRTIKITLADNKLSTAEIPTVSTKKGTKTRSTKASSSQEKMIISEEEPFVEGNFEKDALSSQTVVSSAEAPEEVQKILEIFPGELMG